MTAGWMLGKYSQFMDYEVLNGQVLEKTSEHVSCSHSYSCNCTKEGCSTCYMHDYDIDWVLKTNVGDIKIDREDSRGTKKPERFARAQIGDPVAATHMYTNYIKAAPDSLFHAIEDKQDFAKYKALVPQYPDKVFDYHYVNRVLAVNTTVPDLAEWNKDLALRLRNLGPAKQANIVIVFVDAAAPAFANALRVAWLGGKKNDVVVVIGTKGYPDMSWVQVMSWTDKELFKVQLRDALLDLKTLDRTAVLNVLESQILQGYVRKPMKDFKYLEAAVEPPTWGVILLVLVTLAASFGVTQYYAGISYRSYKY